jgi:hypothetical protein
LATRPFLDVANWGFNVNAFMFSYTENRIS